MPERPTLTLGVEEEYLIVDRDSHDLVRTPDPEFMEQCRRHAGERVTNEYLQCQVEIGTQPRGTVNEIGEELYELRSILSEAGSGFGYALIAASTHPFARWKEQTHTRKDRYDTLRIDMGHTARRLLICGMHIHIGIEDEDLRIDLMNQASYFLPHLLALSCSSPFWEGEDTSLSSYRLAVFDSMPRTGLPDPLTSFGEYTRLINQLVKAGCLEDATKIWWDIRPSAKFPTLEQRITDVCSYVDDTIAIAAAFQSLIAYLYRLRSQNQSWRRYPATLIGENRWRAQRYGTNEHLIDHGKSKLVAFPILLDELIELVSEEANELGCGQQVGNLRAILQRGNSTNRQRECYQAQLAKGKSRDEALRDVVGQLIGDFLHRFT